MIALHDPPYVPGLDRPEPRLPGTGPLAVADWLDMPRADTPAQFAERDRLIAGRRDEVIACLPEGEATAAELVAMLKAHLAGLAEWEPAVDGIRRPDGAAVALDRTDPLGTVGRLIQEDMCLLAREGDGEYRLVAAVLCFPAHWRLSEKLGRPMTAIHDPVPDYDAGVARRVNRLFEAIRPGTLLTRHNWSLQGHPELFAPSGEAARKAGRRPGAEHVLRTERQTLRRLPETGAVAFGIRTALTPVSALSPEAARALDAAVAAKTDAMAVYKGGRAYLDAARAALAAVAEPAP